MPRDEIDDQLHAASGTALLFDNAYYLLAYADVLRAGLDSYQHFIGFGMQEGRRPNQYFDPAWYLRRYDDVAASGADPLQHYLLYGARELRDPHPEFDAAFYVDRHPEAARNPLAHYLHYGAVLGFSTRRVPFIPDYMPSRPGGALLAPAGLIVDIVIPVYRGEAETRRCVTSVLADTERPPGRLIVVDDRSPEPALSAWLDTLNQAGKILLIRNARNMGFVGSVNRGIQAAEPHDVVLLNADTEVPAGWLRRLAAHAYAGPRVASVSPFSNNATICSYPRLEGGPPAFGLPTAELDAAAREANAGRSITVPVTVGFAMYLRRDAVADVGLFDAEAFGRGYGEEADFCMRAAARGWTHRLACDTYVHHQGEVSFGPNAPEQQGSQDILRARYPGYERLIARHVGVDDSGPPRFALTAALFRRSGLPTVLLISHRLGGGVATHIERLMAAASERVNFLLLQGTHAGAVLSVPGLRDHPRLTLPRALVAPDDLVGFLRSAAVARVHVHHLLGVDFDVQQLIAALDVPFDVTVHDWFAVCPQINLLPHLDSHYCGEPAAASCNACIAERPQHGARDILGWRARHAWLFLQAERVICPSADVQRRLARYGLAEHAVVVPHEQPAEPPPEPQPLPRPAAGTPLRVALIGVLAEQKGLGTLLAVIAAAKASGTPIAFHLIGYAERDLPPEAAELAVTGRYDEDDLPGLLKTVAPHVAWFPAQWPETFSYTLSAAITAGLPIVASAIGAFPERLDGRKLTWLLPPTATPAEWLGAFKRLRAALPAPTATKGRPSASRRPPRPDLARTATFYAGAYARPLPPATAGDARLVSRGLVDLRRPGRRAVVVVPERQDDGGPSPCAYIRLLQPLSHVGCADGLDVVVATPAEALRYRADIIATQRYALADAAETDALAAHAAESGAVLAYDLDDDLANIPDDHPEVQRLRPRAAGVLRAIARADVLTVSTPGLRAALADLRSDAVLVPNGLDEGLWAAAPGPRHPRQGPVRFLIMGTVTHDQDFGLIEQALVALHANFGSRVSIDVIGTTSRPLPPGVNRLVVPALPGGAYPAFVNWIAQQPAWHVGITPLVDSRFNEAKSAIKAMDYAALGLAVVASNVPAYRDSIAANGLLVPPNAAAWTWALGEMVRDPRRWAAAADACRAAFLATCTLGAQAAKRNALWRSIQRRQSVVAAPPQGRASATPPQSASGRVAIAAARRAAR